MSEKELAEQLLGDHFTASAALVAGDRGFVIIVAGRPMSTRVAACKPRQTICLLALSSILTGCAAPLHSGIAGCQDDRSVKMLTDAGMRPLCDLPPPTGSDFTLRYTTFMFSSHGAYTYSGRSGHLLIDVADESSSTPTYYHAESKLAPGKFRALLQGAGLDALWQADDPDCDPHATVTVEFGSILEFQDATGYHVRDAPRAQIEGCTTPYGQAFREVRAVVDELDALPTRQ